MPLRNRSNLLFNGRSLSRCSFTACSIAMVVLSQSSVALAGDDDPVSTSGAETAHAPARNAASQASAPSDATASGVVSQPTDANGSAKTDVPKRSRKDDADDIRVGGGRFQKAPGSAHVISERALERYRYDDVDAVLLSVPGVYVRGEDGMGLRPNIGIRGANSDRSKKITLMEDGVLFGPAPYSAPAAYYFPMIARMQTVRVVKGPSSILYGPNTIGGAIDFITQDVPASRKGSLDLGVGEYGYNKIHALYGASDERFGFLIEGVRIGTTGFKEIDGAPDANTGFVKDEWMAKATYVVDPLAKVRHEFGLKVGYSDEDSHETYLGLSDPDFRANPQRRYRASIGNEMKWFRTQAELRHRVVFSPSLDITTTVYRHDFDRTWRKVNGVRGADIADVLGNPDRPTSQVYLGILAGTVDSQGPDQAVLIGPNHRIFVSEGIQTRARWKTATGPVHHDVDYGIRYHFDSIRRIHTQDGFLMQGGNLVPDGRVTETTADNEAATNAVSMHVQDTLTYGPVTLSPGIRAELIHSELSDYLAKTKTGAASQALIPGVGAFVSLTKELGILAGVHRGYGPPAPGQVGAKPEASANFEAGARYTRRRVRAEVIGFYNDYYNLTDICTESNGCSNANLDKQFDAGKARIYGAEAFLEWDVRLPKSAYTMPLRVSYTFTKTELLSNFVSADPQLGIVKSGYQLPYIPVNQLTFSAGIEREKIALNVAGTYVGQMREQASTGDNAVFTDSYFTLDASATVPVNSWLRFYGNIRNIMDTEAIASRRPFGARPIAPRWIQVGTKIDF